MIRNDYIVTSSDRIQDELNNNDKRPQERQHKSIQLLKQLDEVVAGKQKLKSLSNPIRPIAQCYVDIITRDSSLSPAHRQVFHSYLNTHIDKIPFYLRGINEEKSTNTGAPQSGNRSNVKRKIIIATVGHDQQKKQHKTLLTKLLSPKKLHSRKELTLATKKASTKKNCLQRKNPPPTYSQTSHQMTEEKRHTAAII